jgi:hypothetical protein
LDINGDARWLEMFRLLKGLPPLKRRSGIEIGKSEFQDLTNKTVQGIAEGRKGREADTNIVLDDFGLAAWMENRFEIHSEYQVHWRICQEGFKMTRRSKDRQK